MDLVSTFKNWVFGSEEAMDIQGNEDHEDVTLKIEDDDEPLSSMSSSTESLELVNSGTGEDGVSQQKVLCLVCGDRAADDCYDVLTCIKCKRFFRRAITKNVVYVCTNENNCEINMHEEHKCQECWLQKCLAAGMKSECVMPWLEVLKTKKAISSEQQELIRRIVYLQKEFENPSDEELKRIFNMKIDNEDSKYVRFRHITEITILMVQLIVAFAKPLPGFEKFLREDQITLLKRSTQEVMMLWMARKYDVQTDSILLVANVSFTNSSYRLAGMEYSEDDSLDDLLRFCRKMLAMKITNVEYALLTAIVIFSDRPNLKDSWKAAKIREIYVETLEASLNDRYKSNSSERLEKLLSVQMDLKTLSSRAPN